MKIERLCICILFFVSLMMTACGSSSDSSSSEPDPNMTKDEARALGGKSDHIDFCDFFHWYGDGVCDDFCPNPDPDCGATDECTDDADCPDGFCQVELACLGEDCPPPQPAVCVFPDCDDGSAPDPLCDMVPVCEPGETTARINGCFECVDARTCEPTLPGEGDFCGGIGGLTCADGLVCEIEPGQCDVSDAGGTCVVATDSCTQELLAPVCGCDGQTYNGVCDARMAGVAVDHHGPCDATGQECGGFPEVQCPVGFVCELNIDQCGLSHPSGTCQPQVQACAQVIDPVCGCDGQTYDNACLAHAAGVGIDHEGACPDVSCGGFAGLQCPDGQYCHYTPDQMCGAADHLGTCRDQPDNCNQLIAPVCGCDGQSYTNACEAAAAGVAVTGDGPC